MMVVRHMHEFGTTKSSWRYRRKNHIMRAITLMPRSIWPLTLKDVMKSEYIAWPLKRHDICVMSDGAAVAILASEAAARKFCENPIKISALERAAIAMRLRIDRTAKCL